jgi:hypothetical protein
MTAVAIAPDRVTQRTLRDVAEQFSAEHTEKLAALTNRVETYKKAKADAVADTRAFSAVVVKPSDENLPPQLALAVPSKGFAMTIGEVAHGQLSQRLKIDAPYYKRMTTEAPDLLAQNLNYWMQNKPEDRLFRMLDVKALDEAEAKRAGSIGARFFLRGVLGKGYRTIDDADLIAELLPVLVASGALLRDFSIDERRLHAKFSTVARGVQDILQDAAQRTGKSIEALRREHVIGVDEVISSGLYIRHSEVGFASLSASMYDELLRCYNGYISHSDISIRHVGGKNGKGENDEDVRMLSDATQVMENAALLGRVRDRVDSAFLPQNIAARGIKFLEAKLDVVKLPDVPLFEFVGNMGEGLGLTLDQTELLKQETLKAQLEEGGNVQGQITRFGLVQGITAVARQMTDYDRRVEIERAGFTFLNDDANALLKLAREGASGKRGKNN